MRIDPIELSQRLIRKKTTTPMDDGVVDLLISILKPLGFICHKLTFSNVTNLYARIGNKIPNLCFAGHTDVVPVGGSWRYDPFGAEIVNGKLYGRGSVDMKPPIAAFITAVKDYLAGNLDGSISLLISGNEEGDATYGTPKVLEWMQQNNEVISDCLIGEPTSVKRLGDRIHIGRRGSINFNLTVKGIQGHIAYPHYNNNPNKTLIQILHELNTSPLDQGSNFFDPSNLEVASIDVGNYAYNVVPSEATAKINIRYNDLHDKHSLFKFVDNICKKHTENYTLDVIEASDSFISHGGRLTELATIAIAEICGIKPELSTAGATSDARYIVKHCPTLEVGLVDKLAHKVDEHVMVSDINNLTKIYYSIIVNYFNKNSILEF